MIKAAFALGSWIAVMMIIYTVESQAQTFRNSPVELIARCIQEATAGDTTEKKGQRLLFKCYEGIAQSLYDALARQGTAAYNSDTSMQAGTFRRMTQQNACYHLTQDASGKSISAFTCNLYLDVGSFLN